MNNTTKTKATETRLLYTTQDGAEHMLSVSCVSEGRDLVQSDWSDWVIIGLFTVRNSRGGSHEVRVLDAIE